jgi:hypothetical protein
MRDLGIERIIINGILQRMDVRVWTELNTIRNLWVP